MMLLIGMDCSFLQHAHRLMEFAPQELFSESDLVSRVFGLEGTSTGLYASLSDRCPLVIEIIGVTGMRSVFVRVGLHRPCLLRITPSKLDLFRLRLCLTCSVRMGQLRQGGLVQDREGENSGHQGTRV